MLYMLSFTNQRAWIPAHQVTWQGRVRGECDQLEQLPVAFIQFSSVQLQQLKAIHFLVNIDLTEKKKKNGALILDDSSINRVIHISAVVLIQQKCTLSHLLTFHHPILPFMSTQLQYFSFLSPYFIVLQEGKKIFPEYSND